MWHSETKWLNYQQMQKREKSLPKGMSMKVQIERKDLSAALATAVKIAPKKQPPARNRDDIVPPITNVLLKGGPAYLSINATDRRIDWSCLFGIEEPETFRVLVNARGLQSLIKALPKGPLHLSSEAGNLLIEAGLAVVSMPTVGVNFPDEPTRPAFGWKHIDGPGFLAALKEAIYPAKTAFENHCPKHECVFFLPADGGGTELFATDGHRFAVAPLMPLSIAAPFAAPLDLCKLLLQVKAKKISWACENGQVFFRADGQAFAAPTLDTTVPDFREKPPQGGAKCKVKRAELLDALKVVACWKGDKSVSLSFTSKNLTLIRTGMFGNITAKVPMTFWEGNPRTMLFTPSYLLDAVKAIAADEISIRINGDSDPIVLASIDPPGHIHAVMPRRL